MGLEVWIVAGVVVLLFGSSQLPKLARSLGQAKKELETAQGSSPHAVPAPENPAPSAPSPDDPERR